MRDTTTYFYGLVKKIVAAVFFIFCIALIVLGQRHIGIPGTLTMLGGLAGILLLLYLYNRKYQ